MNVFRTGSGTSIFGCTLLLMYFVSTTQCSIPYKTDTIVNVISISKRFHLKSSVTANGVEQNMPITILANGGKTKPRTPDNFRFGTKWIQSTCKTSSCVVYLYCFGNKSIRCFDFRMKHSIEKTQLIKGLVDYGRFLRTNRTKWQKQYVRNYQVMARNILDASSDDRFGSSWMHFLVLYCSPVDNSNLLHCLDIEFTPEAKLTSMNNTKLEEISKNFDKRTKETVTSHMNNIVPISNHKGIDETQGKKIVTNLKTLGFCFAELYNNSSMMSYSAEQHLFFSKEDGLDQQNSPALECIKKRESGYLMTIFFPILAISCLGNAIIFLAIRNLKRNAPVLAEISQYRKNAEEEQRKKRENMIRESETKWRDTIRTLISSISLPLLQETRNFNEWLESPD